MFVKGANDSDPSANAPQNDQVAAGNLDLPRSEDDAHPYTIYGRGDIQRSGVVNLNEFLQRES